jgi:hypothetical protein
VKEQRRFPRVQFSKTLAGLSPDLQAQISWPNHEISEIVDLSYKGMAVRRPGLYPVNVQQKAEIEVALGHLPAFRTSARIAWCNLDWVGLEFASLPADGHLALRDFLDAKLVGTMMKPVERMLVHDGESFQYWYQGPGQTHVYVWMSAGRVERVNVDMDGKICEFARGQPRLRLKAADRRALLVLSQMDKEGLPMEEFVRSLLLGA